MDDQAWAELEAETLGMAEPVAPSGDEPELSLQSDPSIPDTQETDSPETQDAVAEAETPTEAEAVAPEVHERIVALEQELAQHRAAKEAEQASPRRSGNSRNSNSDRRNRQMPMKQQRSRSSCATRAITNWPMSTSSDGTGWCSHGIRH